MLALIELARISRLCNELDEAEIALEQAQALAPQETDSFEEIEIAHARAEILILRGKLSAAELLAEKVVSRYATDDLAGREIVARFLQAQIFDGLAKSEQAERTLAAALRRALARGLYGYVDEARSQIAARGASQGTWHVERFRPLFRQWISMRVSSGAAWLEQGDLVPSQEPMILSWVSR